MADKTTTHSYEVKNLVTGGSVNVVDSATLAQDAGRTEVFKCNTIVGYRPGSEKYGPFDPTAVDGSAYNIGIYMGEDIPAADIVAGDVVNLEVAVGGRPDARIREDMIVFDDGTTTLDTVVGTGATQTTVRNLFYNLNIFPQNTETMNA